MDITEELDPRFAKRDARRKAGLPVEIALTERLLIRESVKEDIPALIRLWQQEGLRHQGEPLGSFEEERVFWMSYIRHMYSFYDFGLWSVVERRSHQLVGQAGLSVSELLSDGIELGYLIDPEERGKGFATECGSAILSYVDTVLELPELHLTCKADNEAAIRTARRLGFASREQIRYREEDYIHFQIDFGGRHDSRRIDHL